MKTDRFSYLLRILPIILLLGASFTLLAGEDIVLPDLPRISVEELKGMVDKNADIVIVDTRDGGSYAAGHIKGAINIPYDVTSDPMQRQMMLIALPMDKLIVTYCDCTDDANSANVVQELYDLGYDLDKLKVLSGGSLRWVELKYPMVGI
ncbi:MAG: rhodanese-like domain-containing protein [Acidobacteria bacterium]|nr:rhodanese-like domain-containing protein [Acidobacteriota bacterium]